MEVDSLIHLSQLSGLTANSPSPFSWNKHRAYAPRGGGGGGGGGSRLLLCCLHAIPGQRYNHDNYHFAIRGVSTKRRLHPAMRNGRQKSKVENKREGGDFA